MRKKKFKSEKTISRSSQNLHQVPIINPSYQRSDTWHIPTINSNRNTSSLSHSSTNRTSPSYSKSSGQFHSSRNEMSHSSTNPLNTSTNFLPSQSFTSGGFLGLPKENSSFPGSLNKGESGFQTTSYFFNTNNVSYPSNSSGNVSRNPIAISKALNIEEFGSMDSDNEDDITNPLTQTGGFWEGKMANLESMDDSIDGVPVGESVIRSSKFTSNQNSKGPLSRTNTRSSDEILSAPSYPKDPQNAMHSFIQALKNPELFRKQSKKTPNYKYMPQPFSSSLSDKFVHPVNALVDLTSDDESSGCWTTKPSSKSSEVKFMRPNDSEDSESPREKRRPKGEEANSHRLKRSLDTRASQASTSGASDRINTQRSDSRTVDSDQSRERFLRESSRRSSKVPEKEDNKSVKLSWHSTPVDRRKGESEDLHQEKESNSKNSLLKGLKQTSKMYLGNVNAKERDRVSHDLPSFGASDDQSEIQNNDTVGSFPTSTLQQGLLQNAILGLPANVLPQDQASMQNLFMGLLSNLMLNADQGLKSSNPGIPGNLGMHPSGLGLGNNMPTDLAFKENANLSALQESIRQQFQNTLLQTGIQGIAAAGKPQSSMQVPNTPALRNFPQPGMLQPSSYMQPMAATRNLAPKTTSSSHRMPSHALLNKPPADMLNRFHVAIQKTTSPVSINNPYPSCLNISPRVIQNQPPNSSLLTPQVSQNKSPGKFHPSPLDARDQRLPATEKAPILPTPSYPSINRPSPAIKIHPSPIVSNQTHSVTREQPLLLTPSIPPPAAPQVALSGVVKNAIISPSVDEVMKKLAPDGTGTAKYAAPDTNLLTFDPEIGYRYDPKTGLHYDANSGYFFNSKLKVFLYWDLFTQTYLRVENPTIPFPVFRNQKDSTENQPTNESPGNIINMKKLIEQHRQIKLEQEKANQDQLSQTKIHSHSGSQDRGMSRSRKRLASPSGSDDPKRRQPRIRSPRSRGLSPKGVERSNSPTTVKKRRWDDDRHASSPLTQMRSISPGTSNRWRYDRRKSGSPDNRRRSQHQSPMRRPSHSKSPPGLSDNRKRTKSPDHSRRHPESRSPQRRRSRSKSPPGFSKKRSPSPGSTKRVYSQNRTRSPDLSRIRPVSRSPQRRRSRSKSHPTLSKKRSISPVPTRRPVNSLRRPGSRSPPRRRSRSRSPVGLLKKRSPSSGPSRSTDNRRRSSGTTGVQNSKRHPTSRSPKRTRPFSRSPPGPTRRRSPSPWSVTARSREQRGRSKTLIINEDVPTHPSLKVSVINKLTQRKSNERKSPKGKSSIDGSTGKDKELSADTDTKNAQSFGSGVKVSIEKNDERAEESKTFDGKDSKDPKSTHSNGKSEVTRRNSCRDRRNVSKSDGKRYSSNKEEDIKLSDKRSDRRDREKGSIIAKQKENSPTSGGRNHRLVSERQFGIGETRKVVMKEFTFPQVEISQSKLRPSSQLNPVLSVESKEKVETVVDLPGDLSDFVVLDGVEDEDEDSRGMTEEALQLLLSDPMDPNEAAKVNDEPEQAGDNSVPSRHLSASSTSDENRDSHVIKESAKPGTLDCINESITQEEKIVPDTVLDKKIQESDEDDITEDKSALHQISTYSEPPSPTCSIFSSYDFSDDGKYVTVSMAHDEGEDEEEICFEEDECVLSKKIDPEYQTHEDISVDKSKIDSFDFQYSNADTEVVGNPKPVKATEESGVNKQLDISKTEDDSDSKTICNDVESPEEVNIEEDEDVPKIDNAVQVDKTVDIEGSVLSQNVVEDTLSAVMSQMSKKDMISSGTGLADVKTPSDSQGQYDEQQIHGIGQAEDRSLASSHRHQHEEQSLDKSCELDKGSLDSKDSNAAAEVSVSTKETQDKNKSAEVGLINKESQDKNKVITSEVGVSNIQSQDNNKAAEVGISNKKSQDKNKAITAEVGVSNKESQDKNKAAEVGGSNKESQDKNKAAVVGVSNKESQDKNKAAEVGVSSKESQDKNKAAEVGVITKESLDKNKSVEVGVSNKESQDKNEAITSEAGVSKKAAEVGVSNKESLDKNEASQDKKVGNVFARLGFRDSEKSLTVSKISENRVKGDKDPLSDLYESKPSKLVHVKQSMPDFDVRTVKDSITQHLFENDIDFVKIAVNQKNNLGCPFEYIQVIFASAVKAEQWLRLTGRKIVLQHTPGIEAEYFLYYAQPPWRCSNCSKSWNIFFRSLCYLCYSHRSDPITCFKFSETPTKYLGVFKIPSSAPLNEVMRFAPKMLNQLLRRRKSVRVVVDPITNCCCGLIIVEMHKVKDAVEVYDTACTTSVNNLLEYVDLDTNVVDDKVILHEVPQPVRKVGNNAKPKPPLKQYSLRDRSQMDYELGVPPDFERAESPDSIDDLQVRQRVVEYDSGRERPQKNVRDHPVRYQRSLSPVHHLSYQDKSMSPERLNYRSSSPLRRNVSPNQASSSRGCGNQDYRQRSGSRGRHSRSISPRQHSSQRYRFPSPRRFSPERRTSSRPPKPDGTDTGWFYPPPDATTFQVESQTGLLYDPSTTLYYHAQSRLFYNGDLNIYLEYDPRSKRYILVE